MGDQKYGEDNEVSNTGCPPTTNFQIEFCHPEVSKVFSLVAGRVGMYEAVFEINGAHGARRAHFRGRAHVFRTCAPDVCTFFHSILIAIY